MKVAVALHQAIETIVHLELANSINVGSSVKLNGLTRYAARLSIVGDDKSDRASIMSEAFFCMCLAPLAFFILRSEQLRSTSNIYLFPTAVLLLAISAGLSLAIVFRLRRLHVASCRPEGIQGGTS